MEDTTFRPWRRDPIPAEEGLLRLESSNRPVPYRIARCFVGEVDSVQCRALAMSSCRISCMATDAVRDRLPLERLQRSVTGQALRKLDNMAIILRRDAMEHPLRGHRMGTLPVVPQSLNGMLVRPDKLEMHSHLTIGTEHHWVNVILRRIGSRWMCVMVDVG
ncbi:hypothetical protein [Bifidobacterium biavatii]|uniref:Uncharacterized protein n=1 Tax=Bifidobacterium biavatii DSM 23969 TaxID=1437608 RepID=A0A086ZTF9_9BIFI|nr:hypothetical protein [Bifidobacterium biavatii]KFI49809.1 hypothetical protein BBIA_1500 [Bifidobacterium biavatii DSM 23969]